MEKEKNFVDATYDYDLFSRKLFSAETILVTNKSDEYEKTLQKKVICWGCKLLLQLVLSQTLVQSCFFSAKAILAGDKQICYMK